MGITTKKDGDKQLPQISCDEKSLVVNGVLLELQSWVVVLI